ncbi:hypothetical protein SOM61_08475 [Massilia sp. CFBP9012]|uniref:hypothetical protein n=1 Tax=Massilia sp. CFBP9012 TaxID=3096531 RepID=UPI002A6A338B|nr:hypothetical protein [Massilia sp. CFBP9012]MDY0974995.1 hypothetical protein [Massilia sp. CFBP9012]
MPRHITKLAFRNRFSMSEKTGIELAALHDPGAPIEQRQASAGLRVYLADLNAATYIDLENEGARAGVLGLEAMGIIDAGRATQILDAEILGEERFYA